MICITGSALSVGLFGVGAVLGASIADVTDWGAAAGLALMFIGRILHGVTGGTAAAAQAMIVDVTPPAQRTQALGLVGVAIGLGFVIGPGAASWLMEIHLSLPIAIAVAIFSLDSLNPFQNMIQTLSHPRVGPLSLGFGLFFYCSLQLRDDSRPVCERGAWRAARGCGSGLCPAGGDGHCCSGCSPWTVEQMAGGTMSCPHGDWPGGAFRQGHDFPAAGCWQPGAVCRPCKAWEHPLVPSLQGFCSPMWRPLPRFRLPC